MSATQAGISALVRSPRQGMRSRVAEVMSSVLPGSGFGPSADRLDDWKWGMRIDGRTAGGNEVRVDVDADGHPGYLATARMLGEAGLLLAEEGATPEVFGRADPCDRARHGRRSALRARETAFCDRQLTPERERHEQLGSEHHGGRFRHGPDPGLRARGEVLRRNPRPAVREALGRQARRRVPGGEPDHRRHADGRVRAGVRSAHPRRWPSRSPTSKPPARRWRPRASSS